MSRNLAAFLAMLAHAEGTDQVADPYACCFAYKHTVKDMRDHPAVTGEWAGERLTEQQCMGLGLGKRCVSTAAGKYQITRGTWVDLRRLIVLPDFGPASQDKAAAKLIEMEGALQDVEAGRIAQAIDKCKSRWASLPGANAPGQPQRKLEGLLAFYARDLARREREAVMVESGR